MFKLKNKLSFLLALSFITGTVTQLYPTEVVQQEQTQFDATAQECAQYADTFKKDIIEATAKLYAYESYWKNEQGHSWTYRFSKNPLEWFSRADNSSLIKKHATELGAAIKRSLTTLGNLQQIMDASVNAPAAETAQKVCALVADYYANPAFNLTTSTPTEIEQHLKQTTPALLTQKQQALNSIEAHKPRHHVERYWVAYTAGTIAALAATGVLIANKDAIQNNVSYAVGGIKHFLKLHVFDPLTEIKHMYWDHANDQTPPLINVERELIPDDICAQARNNCTNALAALDRQIEQEKAALRPVLREYLKKNTPSHNVPFGTHPNVMAAQNGESLFTPQESAQFDHLLFHARNTEEYQRIQQHHQDTINIRQAAAEEARLDAMANRMIEYNDTTEATRIFSGHVASPISSTLFGGHLVGDVGIQALLYKLMGLKVARTTINQSGQLGIELAVRKIRDINTVYRDGIDLLNKHAKNLRIFGSAAQMLPAVFVGGVLGSAGTVGTAAGIGGYYLYKQAHKKQYLVEIKSTLRSIDQYLNKLNNPRAFCTPEQYGSMVFQVNQLKKPAQSLNYEQRKLFLDDIAELESTGTTVAQKIGTLTRMYRTHAFLNA